MMIHECQPASTAPEAPETGDTRVSAFLTEVKWLDEAIRNSPRLQGLIDAFWREMWGGEGRELGNPYREYFKTCPEDLGLWIRENEEAGRPSYISVNTYSDRDRVSRISELFFEFDSKEEPPDLMEVWIEAKGFAGSLETHYGVKPLIVFSGRRGFHIHLFLQHHIGWGLSQDHLTQLYRELSRMILRGVGLKTLDPSPVGDVKRLARLPYTVHEGSGLLCVPVDAGLHPVLLMPGWSHCYRGHGIDEELVRLAVRHIDEKILNWALKPRRLVRHGMDKSLRGLRPCVRDFLEGGDIHAVPRLMLVAAVAEMHSHGYSGEEIIQAFSKLRGYDERETRYQVNHIIGRGYKPSKCVTIKGFGCCLGPECPRYRRKFGGGG